MRCGGRETGKGRERKREAHEVEVEVGRAEMNA